MTTIDHQQAVEAVQGAILGINVLTAERALTAATPHLRAEWEQELREAVTDEIHSVVAAFSDSQMETLLTGDLVAAHARVTVLTHSKEAGHEMPDLR